MNDSPALSPGARMLKSVDEGFFKFEKFLNFLAALVILGIMFIGTFQVFGRKLLRIRPCKNRNILTYNIDSFVDLCRSKPVQQIRIRR